MPLDSSLKARAEHDAAVRRGLGRRARRDGPDRYLGVLTPATLHEALRRSVDADTASVDPSTVEVDSVARV